MKNKELQKLLAKYPDDLEVDVACHNYHTGQTFNYELSVVELVKRNYFWGGRHHEIEMLNLTGKAEKYE